MTSTKRIKSFSQDVESLSKDVDSLSVGIKNFGNGFADGFVQGGQEVIKWYGTAFASIFDLFKNSVQSVQLYEPVSYIEHPEILRLINMIVSDTLHQELSAGNMELQTHQSEHDVI